MPHTPGPWINDEGLVNGRDSRERFAGTPSEDIFDSRQWPTELADEALANAALIAAAPQLLAMTKLFASSIEYEMRRSEKDGDDEGARLKRLTLNIVLAAITKAEAA